MLGNLPLHVGRWGYDTMLSSSRLCEDIIRSILAYFGGVQWCKVKQCTVQPHIQKWEVPVIVDVIADCCPTLPLTRGVVFGKLLLSFVFCLLGKKILASVNISTFCGVLASRKLQVLNVACFRCLYQCDATAHAQPPLFAYRMSSQEFWDRT